MPRARARSAWSLSVAVSLALLGAEVSVACSGARIQAYDAESPATGPAGAAGSGGTGAAGSFGSGGTMGGTTAQGATETAGGPAGTTLTGTPTPPLHPTRDGGSS